ncbi:MAG: PrsW family glutamic-type intramembrane protease [Deltaproteobacteria bacterium]|nr:PrsW family glutamic-type intramembrane protease [Deltaproteobacteria bacterium]
MLWTHALMLSSVIPSLLLLTYFYRRDTFPEPWDVLVKTFVLGVLSVIPVLMVALPASALIKDTSDSIVHGFLQAFLTAAAPEEFFKLMVVWFYCARHKAFDEPMDGVVYGVVASLGFATLENVLYVSTGGLGVALLRALLAVPGHAFMGAVMGYFVGQARARPDERTKLLLLAYVVPVILHGLYDFPLLALKPVREGEPVNPLAAWLLPITLGTFVFEWIWTVRIVRRLRTAQRAISNPSAIAPQREPSAHLTAPPTAQQPVVGAILVAVGVIASSLGGLSTLFWVLALVTHTTLSFVEWLTVMCLFGVLPLGLGLVSFFAGVRRLNGR